MLWVAEGVAEIDDAEEIGVDVVDKLDEGRREAEKKDEVANPVVLEGVEVLIVITGRNGGRGVREKRFFDVSLGFPADIRGVAVGDGAVCIGVELGKESREEDTEPRASLDAINCTQKSKESMAKGKLGVVLFG